MKLTNGKKRKAGFRATWASGKGVSNNAISVSSTGEIAPYSCCVPPGLLTKTVLQVRLNMAPSHLSDVTFMIFCLGSSCLLYYRTILLLELLDVPQNHYILFNSSDLPCRSPGFVGSVNNHKQQKQHKAATERFLCWQNFFVVDFYYIMCISLYVYLYYSSMQIIKESYIWETLSSKLHCSIYVQFVCVLEI